MAKGVKIAVCVCVWLPAAVVAVCTALGFVGHGNFVIDDCSQLRLLWIGTAAIMLVVCCCIRAWRTAILPSLILVANAAVIAPQYLPVSKSCGTARLTLANINLYGRKNHDYPAMVKYIKQVNPDVICLTEITNLWVNNLTAALPDYRYILRETYNGGTGIISKIPFDPSPSSVFSIRYYGVQAYMHINGKRLLLATKHPPSPDSIENWNLRNDEYDDMAGEVLKATSPVIVMGDLNSTPWSWYFQDFLKKTNLVDTEMGFGVQPSWSAHMPVCLLPLDHCLISKGICCTKRQTGPYDGSDHLPLYVELSF